LTAAPHRAKSSGEYKPTGSQLRRSYRLVATRFSIDRHPFGVAVLFSRDVPVPRFGQGSEPELELTLTFRLTETTEAKA